MNFIAQPKWVRDAWEEFEFKLLLKGKSCLISHVGNYVEVKESRKVSRKRGFDRAGSFGEIIIISSKLTDWEKRDLLALLLEWEAEDMERMLKSATD